MQKYTSVIQSNLDGSNSKGQGKTKLSEFKQSRKYFCIITVVRVPPILVFKGLEFESIRFDFTYKYEVVT